jgi:hypothetical protein
MRNIPGSSDLMEAAQAEGLPPAALGDLVHVQKVYGILAKQQVQITILVHAYIVHMGVGNNLAQATRSSRIIIGAIHDRRRPYV